MIVPQCGSPGSNLLAVEHLTIGSRAGSALVKGVSIHVDSGEILGIAGPSGAGKSLTTLGILGLLPESLAVTGGRVLWRGEDLVSASPGRLRQVRRSEIGIAFQDAMSALHPCQRVRTQVEETLIVAGVTRTTARRQALALLDEVGVPTPRTWGERYPHEWSGGMRQRALLALALANGRQLLIADEPTSSVDVTIQRQLMELIDRLRVDRALAVVLVSHDLTLLGEYADRIAVLAEGEVIEAGSSSEILQGAKHPLTKQLTRGWSRRRVPRRGPGYASTGEATLGPFLLEARGLAVRLGDVPAVRDVSLQIGNGECVALVGESGCGKSTVARALLGLEPDVSGTVCYMGQVIDPHRPASLEKLRREVQLVLQDPASALNPRRSVGWSVSRPVVIHRRATREARRLLVRSLLEQVDLDLAVADRMPHELSGGERQRASIARALSVRPRLLILDEPFSALDAHRRAELIDLLAKLKRELGLSYLLISHDLRTVRAMADRLHIVYLGRVVETGSIQEVLGMSAHPYTRALVSSEPGYRSDTGRECRGLAGEVPDPHSAPTGCAFRSRCRRSGEACALRLPAAAPVTRGPDGMRGHSVACLNPLLPEAG